MAFKYIGTSSTTITDGGTQNPTINGVVVTVKNEGDIVFYTDKRFLWADAAWKYQGDINNHTDVQDALNSIVEAYKGEEVRGSIYDAIALIDTRSSAMEDIVGSKADEIANDALNAHYPLFEIDSDTWKGTCSISGSEMQHLIQYKEAIEPILKVGNNAILHSSTTTANIGTNGPIVKCYYVAPNASNLICYEIHMEYGASKNVTCTRTLTPISGGGGSYTEGDGIDITNDEISIKLRSSNPGLAFDSNGNLYATGSGSSYVAGDNIDITGNVISADIIEPVATFTLTPTGTTPAYTVSCDTTYSELISRYNSDKLKTQLTIEGNNGNTVLNMDRFEYRSGVAKFYFEYTEEDYLYVYEITKTGNPSADTYSYNKISTRVQKKLTAGTGIFIASDGTISLDLPQAEGGGF